jgi:hypothetical protein
MIYLHLFFSEKINKADRDKRGKKAGVTSFLSSEFVYIFLLIDRIQKRKTNRDLLSRETDNAEIRRHSAYNPDFPTSLLLLQLVYLG